MAEFPSPDRWVARHIPGCLAWRGALAPLLHRASRETGLDTYGFVIVALANGWVTITSPGAPAPIT